EPEVDRPLRVLSAGQAARLLAREDAGRGRVPVDGLAEDALPLRRQAERRERRRRLRIVPQDPALHWAQRRLHLLRIGLARRVPQQLVLARWQRERLLLAALAAHVRPLPAAPAERLEVPIAHLLGDRAEQLHR